ncbi:type IV conjugative transfer system lipoprotein TraV [Photobacterium damselae subsp. damselae]|uniref:Type IV conjugative transfer system lipoprotein TraV n=1 Tax=Photobacterium damselae subsp. damselae TaxID=85581 RepID=A0A850QX87_PHODD|nr:type IV conjugative transfer system lipoprotein TraV [Photobacterium damselae subsp. damselae]
MKNNLIITLSILTSFILSGCSGLGIGENEFSCELGANEGMCSSARNMYNLSNQSLVSFEHLKDEDRYIPIKTENNGQKNFTHFTKEENINKIDQSDIPENSNISDGNRMMYSYTNQGTPIRTPTKVMRIWISPWIDAKDALHLSGLVFVDVEPKKWNIGEKIYDLQHYGDVVKFKRVKKTEAVQKQSERTDNLQPTAITSINKN